MPSEQMELNRLMLKHVMYFIFLFVLINCFFKPWIIPPQGDNPA